MRCLFTPALILTLASCASTPVPGVQNTPAPSPTATATATATATEPAPATATATATTEGTDAAPPIATTSASPAAGPPEPTVDPGAPAPNATHPTPTAHAAVAVGGAVAEGHAVFQRICVRCHADGDSDGPTPNKRWPEARMRALIRNGSARMRAIPVTRMSDVELLRLVSYLRSTRTIQ